MFRSVEDRQNDSARSYLNMHAVTPAMHTVLELTARTLSFPAAEVSVVDAATEYTLVSHGDAVDRRAARPRPRTITDHVVRTNRPLTSWAPPPGEAQFAPPHIASFAAVPLLGREGMPIGSLTLFDTRPHALDHREMAVLQRFATVVEAQLDNQRRLPRTEGSPVTVHDLASALDDGHIIPWYQPIVNIDTGAVVSLEALARWDLPGSGIQLPDRFIAVAEDTQLITELDLLILDRALRDLALWLPEHPTLRVSVNVSPQQFELPGAVRRIAHVIDNSGVPAESVILELTETAGLVTSIRSAHEIAALRSLGVSVVLDDFGSGWSSLDRLLNLPVDGFKIDRQVSAMLGSASGDVLFRYLSDMSRELDLSFVTEGIETLATALHASSLGATLGQGHLWSRAIPADDVPPVIEVAERTRITQGLISHRASIQQATGMIASAEEVDMHTAAELLLGRSKINSTTVTDYARILVGASDS